MLHDGARAAVVDPGDASPVLEALDSLGLELAAILVTHHHGDHVGGVDALRERLRGPVWGPARERIPQPFKPLSQGDRLEVLGLPFEVLEVPGHIAYVQREQTQAPLLFCDDTLLSAGCGRLFEGTPAQRLQSLRALAAWPADARVCCTHECTLSKLRLAATVEPGNAAIARHTAHCQNLRAHDLPTLPSSIAMERQINPFLRCGEAELMASARAQGVTHSDAVSVLAALREWKNRF